jgi:hypothetical protein
MPANRLPSSSPAIDGADFAEAYLNGAQFLNCTQQLASRRFGFGSRYTRASEEL